MSEIVKQTASTTLWATIEKVGLLGIQFLIGMVLARILSPSDYGVIALLFVFINIAQVFIDSGFGSALIRKLDCRETDYSTAFFFNIGVGITCYAILFISAPLISQFYNKEILTPVLRCYGLSLIFGSAIIVQNAILTQRLAFKAMAKCNIISTLTSGIVALYFAYIGLGVWSLVIQTIVNAIVNTILISLSTKWKPIWSFSKDSFKYLWSFGSKSLISSLISSLYGNIYALVIGKYYTDSDLGFFNRGHSTATLAPNIVQNVFNKSTLPLLSKVQNDREALVNLYRKFTQLLAFISFPLIFITMVLAKPFILFVLTEKWSEAIPYVQIFSISTLTGAVGMLNLNLLIALGRTDLTLKANIIKKSIGFVVVFCLLTTDPMILAIGSMAIDILCYLVNLYYAKKVISLNYLTQIKDMMPYLLVSILVAITTYPIILMIPSYLFQLIVGALIYIALYFLATRYCLKTSFYDNLSQLFKKN